MIKVINGLAIGLAIGFPFYLWFVGWDHPIFTGLYLISTSAFRFISVRNKQNSTIDWLFILVPIALGLIVMTLGPRAGLFYPVTINLGLFLVFYTSLSSPVNIIQRIAEKIEKHPLDAVGIRYTRLVTKVWCLFFVINCLVSIMLSSYDTLEMWALYNGVLAYVIVLVLLGGERIVRGRVQEKMRRAHQTQGN